MAETFDPYYKWLGIPPKDQPPHHYRLLGIEVFEPDRDVIDAAANRLMGYLKELAAGDDSLHSQKLLNEISRARLCLLNKEKKTAYDQELQAKFKAEEAEIVPPAPAAAPPPQPPQAAFPPVFEPPAFPAPPQVLEPPQIEIGGPAVQASQRPKPPSLRTRSTPPVVRQNATRGGDDERHTAGPAGSRRVANQRMYLAIAGLAAMAIVVGLLAILLVPPANTSSGSGTKASADKDAGRSGGPRPVLTLVLTERERQEISEFLLDDQAQPLPPESEFSLDAGRHHLILRRAGYHEVFDSITLVPGVRREYRPRWRRDAAAAVPPSLAPPVASEPTTMGPTASEPSPVAPGLPVETMDASPAAVSPTLVQEPPPPAVPAALPVAEPPSDAERQTAVAGEWSSGFGRLVAHWPFDNDTGDRTGLRHDGLTLGEAKYVSGRVGNALQFSPELRFEVGAPILNSAREFSFCLWMNLASLPEGEAALIRGETIVLFVRGGHPCVEIGGHKPLPGPGTDDTSRAFQGIDLSDSLGAWVHLGLTYSARFRQLHYYVDGVHRGFQQYADSTPASWGRTIVTGVSGLLDDLRVFDYRLGSADFQTLVDGSFQPPAVPPRRANGKLVCETWNDISPTTSRVELEATLRKKPDETSTIEEAFSYTAPAAGGDRLACIQGFLFPPERGEYTLWLETSGQATLYLQRFEDGQDTLQEIVANQAGQPVMVPQIPWETNRPCYFKILHFYNAASDGTIRLGWQVPNSTDRVDAIPAAHFGSYRPVP